MKKIVLLSLLLLMSASLLVLAQNNNSKKPAATFTKTVHDFAKIKESDKVATCEFVFKNTGNAPIIIQTVGTSCGCTTPDYTKGPILPGKEGKVSVMYGAEGRPGSFDKKINVFTNVADTVYTLTIKGEVIE